DIGDGLSGRRLDYAERIRVASSHCQLMTEQLLVFSRVQQKSLERERLDATPLFRLALLQLPDPLRAAGAEVSIEPLGVIHADRDLVGLAFRHLLDNAVKFRRPEVPAR